MEPISNVTDIEGEEIHYWTKPLAQTVSAGVASRVLHRISNENESIHNVDLVLGGDHGQKKFRMVMKIIVRKETMEIIDEWTIKIAHIDCKHDTYIVLTRETIQ